MLRNQTIRSLRELKLYGMADAFEQQLTHPEADDLAFEERLGLLVDSELASRDTRRLQRLLRAAKLRHDACVEDINYRHKRGLDRRQMQQLARCDWIRAANNLLVTGATGTGKTWLTCAISNAACRQGLSVLYVRCGRLLEELRIAHATGGFMRRLAQIARVDLLVLDDWGLQKLTSSERNDLLEVLEDRSGKRSTAVTSQVPVEAWHEVVGSPTLADAILDRLVSNAHRIKLSGETMRPPHPVSAAEVSASE
jgi:DNA replication protein DnaC